MKMYYVREHDPYQRKDRHFLFADKPDFVSGRWQEKPSYLTDLCPSFVEIERNMLPPTMEPILSIMQNEDIIEVELEVKSFKKIQQKKGEVILPELHY